MGSIRRTPFDLTRVSKLHITPAASSPRGRLPQTLKIQLSSCTMVTIRYDRTEFNVDSKAKHIQLNLAHETKTNKRLRPLSSVQVQDP